MGKLINGQTIADKIALSVAKEVKKLKAKKITPKLGVILVGNDKPSVTYVGKKQLAAQKAGMDFALFKFPANISHQQLLKKIADIQKKENLSGLIIQLPLPEQLYRGGILNAVDPDIDVDCLTDANIGKLIKNNYLLAPPTPLAVLAVLDYLKIKPKGKNIVIIGTGALVGKPLAIMLANQKASVVTCNQSTKNIKAKCLQADIIVTAVGKKDLLTGDMVKTGTVVIDTGICFVKGKMYGDVNREEVLKKASYLTPTPGGIGPITVSLLLKNTILCSRKK